MCLTLNSAAECAGSIFHVLITSVEPATSAIAVVELT
jgi:hypothetical protein